jgi:hypothetical protein
MRNLTFFVERIALASMAIWMNNFFPIIGAALNERINYG